MAYVPQDRAPVPLHDPDGNVVAFLVHVQHVPALPSHVKIKKEIIEIERKLRLLGQGEASPVFSCFYECKEEDQKKWQEVTSLMLINQSADLNLLVEVLFVDGNENPIAKTATLLSPEDLDEINVCETLNQTGIAVPSAGVIEVVLSQAGTTLPVGGAYGWVKNLLGKFKKGVAELFEGKVSGIAKTECRLVGPNVVTHGRIRAKAQQAPMVDPILIEGTGE